jgi:2-dehydro-3-deoxyphosphogalactonate aldolase
VKANAPSDDIALVAILRGVRPDQVVAIGHILYEAGIRTIEVPLNSPDPFASVGALAKLGLPDLRVGTGTVLVVEEVQRTQEAGGRLIVSPNTRADVIRRALQLTMDVMPGFGTATEAFDAIAAGATDLKLFPAVTYGPHHLQALSAVLPARVRVFPVGGVETSKLPVWITAGAAGFGFGSEIFRPNYSLADIKSRAVNVVQAVRAARAP